MIEGWQWLLLALIVLTTVVGFVEAAAFKDYRPSVWRWLGALFVPALWWCGVLYGMPHIPWQNWMFIPVAIVVLLGGPAWFVYSILMWVSWVMCPTDKSQSEMSIDHE